MSLTWLILVKVVLWSGIAALITIYLTSKRNVSEADSKELKQFISRIGHDNSSDH